jgi:hypothetical protein
MWDITEDDAVEMYARYYSARHKRTAHEKARKIATLLKEKGDLGGEKIWNSVADKIQLHRHVSSPPSR